MFSWKMVRETAGFRVFVRLLRQVRLSHAVAMVALTLATSPALAQGTMIIEDDRGGAVDARVQLIQDYKSSDVHLEIRGRFCLSACTMFLGMKNVCVSPDTVFGFHGPSSAVYGIGLASKAFEYWSHVMADHYPEPIKSWYLKDGRNRIVGFHEITGRGLIDLGVAECQSA